MFPLGKEIVAVVLVAEGIAEKVVEAVMLFDPSSSCMSNVKKPEA